MTRKLVKVVIFLFLLSFAVSADTAPILIGSDQCFSCHSGEESPWQKNPHRKTAWGCESCHGAGSAHQETMDRSKIMNPGKIDADALVKVCGYCHFSGRQKLDSKLWNEGMHAQAGLNCLKCHDPHKVNNKKLLIKPIIKMTCYTCHPDIKKKFEKTIHGKKGISCEKCHNPHGSKQANLLRLNGREVCQVCHAKEPHHFIADKVTTKMLQLECVNCHMGNNHLLFLYKKGGDLCVQCHKSVY